MSGRKSKRYGILLGLVLLLSLWACGQEPVTSDGVWVTPEMLESVSQSLSEGALAKDPAQPKETTVPSASTTVTVAITQSAVSATSAAAETVANTTAVTSARETAVSSVPVSETSIAVSEMNQTEAPAMTIQSSVTSQTAETTDPVASEPQADEAQDVVYWTEGGSVYHITDQCSTLRRSKNILHGTVDEALAAKKERPCKTCAKK